MLYFFKYSCTNSFHRRSLYTFYISQWSDSYMLQLYNLLVIFFLQKNPYIPTKVFNYMVMVSFKHIYAIVMQWHGNDFHITGALWWESTSFDPLWTNFWTNSRVIGNLSHDAHMASKQWYNCHVDTHSSCLPAPCSRQHSDRRQPDRRHSHPGTHRSHHSCHRGPPPSLKK